MNSAEVLFAFRLPELSVNVNKIAWLRNARDGDRPDIVEAAKVVLDAGARGITVHPRPDQRHICPKDVCALSAVVSERPAIEFNIEGNPFAGPRDNGFPGFDCLIKQIGPDQCTLVPDTDNQLTSDHGWDLLDSSTCDRLAHLIADYRALGIRVSLFVDPDQAQIVKAKEIGCDRVELYTGPYAQICKQSGPDSKATAEVWQTYRSAAHRAVRIGLGVNAGHDLDLFNLTKFCSIGCVEEVSIGHALIADALSYGLADAVVRYQKVISAAERNAH